MDEKLSNLERRDPKQMRVVFVGRRNAFDWGIIRWLDKNYTLDAAFFIEEDRFHFKTRVKKLRKRAKRLGITRVADELLFRAFCRLRYGSRQNRLFSTLIPEQFVSESTVDIPCHYCDSIHKEKWLSKIREMRPDVIFSVCTHTIFKKKLFRIPRYGLLMLHEGITPEYRGLSTPGWALLKREYEYVGYTLLKIDDGIDSGPILCQGTYPDADKFGFCYGFVGHAALVHGLPEMKRAMDTMYINDGRFDEVSQAGRISNNYSWIPFSAYLRLKCRSLRHRLFSRNIP